LQINKKRSEFPRDFNSTPRMLERYEKRWTIPRAKGGTAKTFLKIYSAGPKCRQVFFAKKCSNMQILCSNILCTYILVMVIQVCSRHSEITQVMQL
jgi:hypothetical protein